jgi:hypothetical protein
MSGMADDQKASKSGGQKLYVCSLILPVSCALEFGAIFAEQWLEIGREISKDFSKHEDHSARHRESG